LSRTFESEPTRIEERERTRP